MKLEARQKLEQANINSHMSVKVEQTHRFLYYWVPVIIWMGIIFYFSSRSSSPLAKVPQESIHTLGECLSHILEFGVLAVLIARAIKGGSLSSCGLSIGLTLFYSLFDELHQLFVPLRSFQVVDLVMDAIGACLGVMIFSWFMQRRKMRRISNGRSA